MFKEKISPPLLMYQLWTHTNHLEISDFSQPALEHNVIIKRLMLKKSEIIIVVMVDQLCTDTDHQ